MLTSDQNHKERDKEFLSLEKEALKEISLEIIKSDLVKSLDQMYQKERKELEKSITTIEEGCGKEIREGIKKHIQEQLEEHFQKVVQSCQNDISNLIAPLLRRAEQDLNSLNTTVSQTNMLCDDIQEKYSFRWDKPFLILIFSTILTGALVSVILILLQASPIAVFLMNKKTREIYNSGLHWKEIKRQMAIRKPEPFHKTQKEDQKPLKAQKKKKLS